MNSEKTRYKYKRKPEWLRTTISASKDFNHVTDTVNDLAINTVCQEAKCPNIHECWGTHRTASFMILGDICTRRCRFCAVKTGLPEAVDASEPHRVALAVKSMDLAHVVITMVNRDDLEDGGSEIMAMTVRAVKHQNPDCTVEILSSDMMGREESIRNMIKSQPDIMSHNLETVERLTPLVRSRSDYDRSLRFLEQIKEIAPDCRTKSSIMLGLGEKPEEVYKTMDDLLSVGVKVLNMGQYLQPSRQHIPVEKYLTPYEFYDFKLEALKKGFVHVEAGPLVRSSYHAADQINELIKKEES